MASQGSGFSQALDAELKAIVDARETVTRFVQKLKDALQLLAADIEANPTAQQLNVKVHMVDRGDEFGFTMELDRKDIYWIELKGEEFVVWRDNESVYLQCHCIEDVRSFAVKTIAGRAHGEIPKFSWKRKAKKVDFGEIARSLHRN